MDRSRGHHQPPCVCHDFRLRMSLDPPSPLSAPRRRRWSRALDVEAHDRQLSRVFRFLRTRQGLSLAEVARRSGLSRQFWSKVEKGACSFSAHHATIMGNALRVRPSVIHRLAERWTRLRQQTLKLLPWLLHLGMDWMTALVGV